ncbi:MAG TPA: hemolysin family protein [Bryobacteraceae bacterium]|nr:hemolysin family protein [Bryobacteraceae bacterium]
MTQSYVGFRLILVALLIGFNGFFAAAEVALLSVRGSRLRQLAEEGVSGAQTALNLLANPPRLLSVTQVGVTLSSLGLGWAGEDTVVLIVQSVFHPAWGPLGAKIVSAATLVLAFLAISYLHVVIGEVVPKNLAIATADRLAVTIAPALLIFWRISLPFVFVIEKSSGAIANVLRSGAVHRPGGHSAEELKLIVTSSRGLGYLPEAQEDMIHRVLDLNELYVREIMVPRNDIISVPVEATLDQVLDTMIEQQHSRLPVYDEKPEQIIGLLHYKDLLPLWQERREAIRVGRPSRAFRIRRLLRKHLVVPETKPVGQMLAEFQQGRSHMAMVVDEFGTISGMLTVEDVLEQIVGPIHDEYDEKNQVQTSAEASTVDLDGATRIRDLETEYGIEIPAEAGFETLAGFLLYRLGYIPRAGDSIEYEGRRYTVVEMERNRIARVRIERVARAAPPAAPAAG